jgi:hypothetical protein
MAAAIQWGPAVVHVARAGGGVVSTTTCQAAPDRGNTARTDEPASPTSMLAASRSRAQLAQSLQDGASVWNSALSAIGVGPVGEEATYWIPTGAAGEVGLLEAFSRKAQTSRIDAASAAADGLDTFVLVFSRPQEELRRNFSNVRGQRVDLTLPHFQYSRSTLALRELDSMADDAALRGKDVKVGLRHNLPKLQEDAYFLVAYRDYSSYATTTFKNEAQRATLTSNRYVERHFAVRVGQSAGVFVPITPAQFHRGWELLVARDMNAGRNPSDLTTPTTPGEHGSILDALQRWALNADQFRGLGPIPRDIRDQVDFDHEAKRRAGTILGGMAGDASPGMLAAAYDLPPSSYYRANQPTPHPWDLTPAAIHWRIQRGLERQYRSLGRVVLKAAVVGGGILVVRYAWRQATGANDDRRYSRSSGARGGSRGGGSRSSSYDQRSMPEAFVDSIVSMDPVGFVSFLMGR